MTDQQKPVTPGSDQALDAGCRCPVLDNAHGRGRGDGTYWISERCPLHAPQRGVEVSRDG
jgi:hypothetical protein